MNDSSNLKKTCFNTCWSLLFFVLLVVFGFLVLGQTNQLELINKRIDDINNRRISCEQACGNEYIQQGQICCLYYSRSTCIEKKKCTASQISNFYTQYDDVVQRIWIYSVLTLLMLVAFCWQIRRGCKNARGAPVQEAVYHGINYSQIQSNHDEKGKRNHSAYQSFAYQDDQSTCCICLEEFNNEKAILLKCGHIFHSLCIRDWAAKQENCPVCRSSQ